MIIRYQDLVTLDLVASDGTSHSIEDVFVDDRELRLRYVVADIGTWFNERKAMIGIERFGAPDIGNSRWPCTLDEEALRDKPEPERTTQEGQKTLPDAMLVPTGSRVSPRLLHRSVGDEHLPLNAHADPKGRIPEGAHLRSVGELILDTDVMATDGKAGKLMGVIFDAEDWSEKYIVVETGGSGLPQNQRVLRAETIDDIDWDGRRVTLNVPNEEVQKALDLHEVDDLESKWYNRVLAYYGLQS